MRLFCHPLPLSLLLSLLLFPAVAAQAQYKWTDHDGVVSYGDQPSRDAEHVEHLGNVLAPADAARDALARLPFEIRKAAQDFPVVLYARDECQPCDAARAFLKSRNVPYTERSVTTREDLDSFGKALGSNLLPSLSVGRQVLRGFETGTWSEVLATAGYPRDIPLPRDWIWPVATPLAPPPNPAPPADNTPPPAPGSNADTR
jgi:glutaredoxin